MRFVTLLGVPVSSLNFGEILDVLQRFLQEGGQHHVVTINSEILVESAKNADFQKVLQGSSLNLPDSMGVVWLARLTGQRVSERVTGVDTVQRFCEEPSLGHSIFLLGGRGGAGRRAAAFLSARNPQLRVAGWYEGGPDQCEAAELVRRINAVSPRILFVAFGAPEQDLWIAKHLHEMPSVYLAMGVGGTFDFLAGVKKRAPVFFQHIGLEWLWRFLHEPWRAKRMWNAVIVFPWLVLRYGRNAPIKNPNIAIRNPKQ